MGRRSGQRLVAAKAYIQHQLRIGNSVTVTQVMQEFPDVATCRSIYRWIAHAKREVENPGQVNRRSQARKFINDSIQRGVRVRVCDVLVKFPDVASTTTVYRWLHEAKRPTNLSHEPQAYIWHVLDNDPQATPPPKSTSSDYNSSADQRHWSRIRSRHSQLISTIELSFAPGQAITNTQKENLREQLIKKFPDAPTEIIERRLSKRYESNLNQCPYPPTATPVSPLAPNTRGLVVYPKPYVSVPGQVMCAPTPRRIGRDKEGSSSPEGIKHSSPTYNTKMHLCCDCGMWLEESSTTWVNSMHRPRPWAVSKKFPLSVQFVHTKRDRNGSTLVTMCGNCAEKLDESCSEDGMDVEEEHGLGFRRPHYVHGATNEKRDLASSAAGTARVIGARRMGRGRVVPLSNAGELSVAGNEFDDSDHDDGYEKDEDDDDDTDMNAMDMGEPSDTPDTKTALALLDLYTSA